jgi:hypothetical protein
MLVRLKHRNHTRRCAVHESSLSAMSRTGGRQIGDITMKTAQIFNGNGTRADRPVIFRGGAQAGQTVFEFWNIIQVTGHRAGQ